MDAQQSQSHFDQHSLSLLATAAEWGTRPPKVFNECSEDSASLRQSGLENVQSYPWPERVGHHWSSFF